MRRENTGSGSGTLRQSDRAWGSSTDAMDLSAEAVQQLDAATRETQAFLKLPADLATQFEHYVRAAAAWCA